MKFTEKDIKHLQNLSALEFSEEETKSFIHEFSALAEFVSQIQKADLPAKFEYNKVQNLEDLREDIAKPSLTNEEVLQNAPKKARGCFSVPLMMD